MPKQIVAFKEGTIKPDEVDYYVDDQKASVVWSRDGQVFLQIDKWQESTDDAGYQCASLFELDREDINKMIRTLRKARDQVFGVDA